MSVARPQVMCHSTTKWANGHNYVGALFIFLVRHVHLGRRG